MFKCTDKEKELRLNVHTYVILICIIYNNNERTKHVILSVHDDIFKKAVIENPESNKWNLKPIFSYLAKLIKYQRDNNLKKLNIFARATWSIPYICVTLKKPAICVRTFSNNNSVCLSLALSDNSKKLQENTRKYHQWKT